jgi:energy-coupling factor transporter ATP-binding protein EcfA2
LSNSAEQGAVVFVYGPAGIGKSMLLRQFAALARDQGATCIRLDARDLPKTLDALTEAVSGWLSSPEASAGHGTAVLIDTYELLVDLDVAVREQLAPRLPADTVLVLAGQQPPTPGWRTDPGWAPLLHTMKLVNLSRDESVAYLSNRGVQAELQSAAIDFTHGHPLALALVGEVVGQKGTLPPADTADVVRVLIDRLLDAVPTMTHRAVLEAAAQVRIIDEPLLAALLDVSDAAELFTWMRGLSFVDAGLTGLYLHDLAREVLSSDLRWRHAQRYYELHDRARQYYLNRLDAADPAAQTSAMLDLIYLHPELRAFLMPPEDAGPMRVEPLKGSDTAEVIGLIAQHEGEESAAIAAHWVAQQPGAWSIVRGAQGGILGTVCFLRLDPETAAAENDPAIRAAVQELGNHPPQRPAETSTLIRFWLSRDRYQSVSPVQSLIATQLARHYLTTTGLAVTLLPFAHPEEWEAMCAYTDQRRAPDADFTVGGRRYSTFVHDWRTVPPSAWVANLSLQEIGAGRSAPGAVDTENVLVLTETEFAQAVRQALRDYTRPERLRDSPLLRCRLITTRTAAEEPVADQVTLLRSLVKDAAETLSVAPADRRLHRVLVRAYLAPAPSLERAAEILELPSSTFRRLLSTALGRVTTLLWHQELDA